MNTGIFNLNGKPADIPLKGVRIHGNICGLHGELSVEQLYINDGKKSLEVVYIFPMPDKAVISQFSARVGDRTITGEIREKGEAFKIYDEALRKGDSAFLLEQFRPNIFQVSLGRILPGEEVRIKIAYLGTISYQDGEFRISIPTLVAPRYIPGSRIKEKKGMGWSNPTDRVPDADFITPPVDPGAAYRVELELNLQPLLPVDEYSSPSHRLNVTAREDGGARITLAEGKAPLDRDIVILGRCREESTTAGLSWKDPETGEGYFYLHLLPHLGARFVREALNFIFLIDISGSMHGAKLQQAKNALQLCLRNMEKGDRFNIAAFESGCYYFSPEGSLPFNQASLDRASSWINKLDSMGGTEIMEPVDFALKSSGEDGTVILLFTDGQVGNEKEIIDRVRRRIRNNRLFAFGIDTAVNSYFINQLAEAGRGLPEFIYPGERIEDKVIRQFYRINSPVSSDVTVKWSAMQDVELYPQEITAIFDREPLILVGKYSGELTGSLSLSGMLKEEDYRVEMDLTRLRTDSSFSFLKKIWAKMKIDHLEKSLEGINPRRRENLVEELVKISREYGVGSAHTSFVAVQERENKVTGIPETVVVPVAPAAGWEMLSFYLDVSTEPTVFSSPSRGSLKYSQKIMLDDTATLFTDRDTAAWSAGSDLQEAVRFIAMQQQADGSFPAEAEAVDKEASIFENTALAALAMLLAAEDTKIYRRQIEKSVTFLLDERQHDQLEEYHYLIAALACRLYLEKMKHDKRAAQLAGSKIQAMRDKAGTFSAALLKPEFSVEELVEELYKLLGDRESTLSGVAAKSGVKKLAAAIFREMLQPGR
ncbi:MAG TPA: VIT domain-containing protein [Bacillota bacterium]|nr:VIT domain-containing protein [Bacillota bacterium]